MRDYFDRLHPELIEWRRDLHRHPELAFEEERTSQVVAEKLESFGIEIHRGLAKTGVVGTLRSGSSDRVIGLRADMDALPITEETKVDYESQNPGVMHACGHDGHTTMLLGAAKYLSEKGAFDGTVHFIFQPAEENEGGARVMIEEGLFKLFPCQRVYGLHNMPGLEESSFGMREGALMAAFDKFEIEVIGQGTHAAIPHRGIDPIVVTAEIVLALQSIVAREIDPMKNAVISVTQLRGGETWNVIPDRITIRGCTRSFLPSVQEKLESSMARVVSGVAAAHGATAELSYEHGYPPTVNSATETKIAAAVAIQVVGSDKVSTDTDALMGSEDFAFMLQEKPGCYVLLGAGPGPMVHNSRYDFNDAILTVGASYWASLALSELTPELSPED